MAGFKSMPRMRARTPCAFTACKSSNRNRTPAKKRGLALNRGPFFAAGTGGQVEGEDRALADLGMDMEGGVGVFDQAVDDAQDQAAAAGVVQGTRGEIRLETLEHDLRRDPRLVVLQG